CSLQVEIELTAEAFSKRERPRFVDAAAEGRMEDELHAAGLIEKTLEHERLLRRNDPQRAAPCNEVARCLFGAALAQSRFLHQPLGVTEVAAQIRHGARHLIASRRRFSEPERNRGRRPLSVANADDAAGDLHYLP